MPSKNELTGNASLHLASTPAANTAAVVTVPASANPGITTYICGVILSATAAPASPVAATLAGVVGGTMTLEIPASAFAVIGLLFGVHPLKITQGVDAVLTLPALGGTTVGSASVLYYYGAI